MFQIKGKAKKLPSFKPWNVFQLNMQRDSCHPKSFGTFEKRAPGICFTKVSKTFRYRKASCQIAICVFWKAALLTCFECKKNQEDCEIWWLRNTALLRCNGNCGTRNRPENFRDFWETGPCWSLYFYLSLWTVASVVNRLCRGIVCFVSSTLSFANPSGKVQTLSSQSMMLLFCTKVERRFLLRVTKNLVLLICSMMYFPPNRNEGFRQYVSPRFQERKRGPWEQSLNLARRSSSAAVFTKTSTMNLTKWNLTCHL